MHPTNRGPVHGRHAARPARRRRRGLPRPAGQDRGIAAAGSGADTTARFIGKHLTEKFGQPFVVENKPAPTVSLPRAR